MIRLLSILCLLSGAVAAGRPNILLIVSDDQGYADISAYEHPAEVSTPSLDRLAASGVRFANGYASAYVCAPTRAGLLTGRYQQRFGFYTAGDSRIGLPVDEITIADVLKEQGYATGIFGKWHVGLDPPYRPLSRGFDEFYGFLGHGAHDYFDLERSNPHNSIYRGAEPIDDEGYLTDNLARESVAFIERHRRRPFFLYLPFNAVHWPMQAPEADVRRFNTGSENRDIYLAMLRRLDQAVGQVLDVLEKHGLRENTLVIFFSDNGGARRNYANNGALRDYKQSVYEGGIRVPFLVSWPGELPAGETSHEPVISLDSFPTICAATGARMPAGRSYDGRNLLPLLRGKQSGPVHDALYWDGDEERWAVRVGDWKLVEVKGKAELFNLASDLGEKNDLSAQRPDLVAELRAEFYQWRSRMGPRVRR